MCPIPSRARPIRDPGADTGDMTHTPNTITADRFTVASSECSAVWGFTGKDVKAATAYYCEVNGVDASTVSIGRKVQS